MAGRPMLLDSQKYMECQVVAAINAAIALGLPPIRQPSVEYERLVNLSGARYGSAVEIDSTHRYLGIRRHELVAQWGHVHARLYLGYPALFHIYLPAVGHHATLATGAKDHRLKMWNYSKDARRWIRWRSIQRDLKKAGKLARCFYFEKDPHGR